MQVKNKYVFFLLSVVFLVLLLYLSINNINIFSPINKFKIISVVSDLDEKKEEKFKIIQFFITIY